MWQKGIFYDLDGSSDPKTAVKNKVKIEVWPLEHSQRFSRGRYKLTSWEWRSKLVCFRDGVLCPFSQAGSLQFCQGQCRAESIRAELCARSESCPWYLRDTFWTCFFTLLESILHGVMLLFAVESSFLVSMHSKNSIYLEPWVLLVQMTANGIICAYMFLKCTYLIIKLIKRYAYLFNANCAHI